MRIKRIKGLPGENRAVILVWLFPALALISAGAALVSQYLAAQVFGWTSTVYRERREFALVEYISLSSADIPLEVYVWDGDKIILDYVGETGLVIDEGEFELKISRDEDFAFSLFSSDALNYKMRVWLPNVTYRDIKLVTASGDISADSVKTGILTATSRAGDINLYGVDGIIALNTRYGNISAEFTEFKYICGTETETGNISVLMPEDSGVKLDFLTDSGRFSSDFFLREYRNYQGDLYLSEGSSPVRFTVRTSTGNLDFCKVIEYIY